MLNLFNQSYVPAFVQRLNELGWIEGRTATIVYRWAEGRPERYTEIAAEFVRLKVDVIVSSGTAVVAAKQVTSVIPIVFAVATDPLGSGLVANLARPGGNVTGLSSQTSDLFGKRLETLREAVPGLRRLAIMGNLSYPGTVQELNEVQAAARTLKLEVATLGIGALRTSRPLLRRSRAEPMHFMCVPTRSQPPTGFESSCWRSARDYQRSMANGRMSRREV
jgi:putative ABC transport system substrate-binding protein